ncbi:hypothetical protein EBL89_18380 [Cereibacter sphaeroides]|uniref:hypothetical protein n=1 Tax=Cereibacter sphaeroides TaxID=1063 RepID=UPI000F53610F|nr:hypothetical protein [Cereibacter sphaeroides]AZB57257.1 hypothetical protein EBL89_18380 [Cereibacter sphaeroides]AZB61541.1 hypothetical protein EBL88_18490 [Cereibacter sphaeroides]
MSRFETSDTLLGDLPELIAAGIGKVLPGLRECRGISGRLDVEELKRRGIAAPAVLVSRLRTRQDRSFAGPHHSWRLQMGAFILCKDELGLPRDRAAANIAQALLRLIPGTCWGRPDDLAPAEAVAEEPLVSLASDRLALALTAVTWEQVVALTPFEAPSAIRPEVYLGQAPQIGSDHEDAYVRIGGAP